MDSLGKFHWYGCELRCRVEVARLGTTGRASATFCAISLYLPLAIYLQYLGGVLPQSATRLLIPIYMRSRENLALNAFVLVL